MPDTGRVRPWKTGPLIEKEGYDSAVRRGVASASALLTEMGV